MNEKLPVHNFTLFYTFLDKYIDLNQPEAILYSPSSALKLLSGFNLQELENNFLTAIKLPISLQDFYKNNFKANEDLKNFIESLPRNLYDNVKIITRKNLGQTFDLEIYSLAEGLTGIEFIKVPRAFENRYIHGLKMHTETYTQRAEFPLISEENFVSLAFSIQNISPIFKKIVPDRRPEYLFKELLTAIRLSQNEKLIRYAAEKKFNFMFEPKDELFSKIKLDDKEEEIFNLDVDYESDGICLSKLEESILLDLTFSLISYGDKTLVADKKLMDAQTKKYNFDLNASVKDSYGSKNRLCFYSLTTVDSLENPIQIYDQIENDICSEIDLYFDKAKQILNEIAEITKEAGEYFRIQKSYEFIANYFELSFNDLELNFRRLLNKEISSFFGIPSIKEKEKLLASIKHDSKYFGKMENRYRSLDSIKNIYWHQDSIYRSGSGSINKGYRNIIIADDNSKTSWLNKVKKYLSSKTDIKSDDTWFIIHPKNIIETMKLKRILDSRPNVYLLSELTIPKEKKSNTVTKDFQVIATFFMKNQYSDEVDKRISTFYSYNKLEENIQDVVFIPSVQSKNIIYLNGQEMNINSGVENEIAQYQKIFMKLYNFKIAVTPKTHINKMIKSGVKPILFDEFIKQEQSNFTWENLKSDFSFAPRELLSKLENTYRRLIEPVMYSTIFAFDTGVFYKILNLFPESFKNIALYIEEYSDNTYKNYKNLSHRLRNINENHLMPEYFIGQLIPDLNISSFNEDLYQKELGFDIDELNQNLKIYEDILIWDLIKYLQQRANILAGFYIKDKASISKDRLLFIPEYANRCDSYQLKSNEPGFLYTGSSCRSTLETAVGITVVGDELKTWFDETDLTEEQRTTINLLDQTYIRTLEPIVNELNLRRRSMNET